MATTDYDLSQLQRWMQSVIAHAGGIEAGIASPQAQGEIDVAVEQVEEVVNPSRACTSVDRLRVYGNAYYARLLECLRESFPCLAFAIGEELFDQFAFGYLQTYPSTSYTLGDLGNQFAKYLDESRPVRAVAGDDDADFPDFLIDLATLEWNIEQVFNGPGVEGRRRLQAEQFLEISADRWPETRLEPVACLRLLEFRFPVNSYYTEFRTGRQVPLPQPQAEHVALTRRDYIVRRFALDEPQYRLLRRLAGGGTIGDAIGEIDQREDEDIEQLAVRLRQWFGVWGKAGFFSRMY